MSPVSINTAYNAEAKFDTYCAPSNPAEHRTKYHVDNDVYTNVRELLNRAYEGLVQQARRPE